MTLAHELGHGVHQYLARDKGVLQQNTPLTTAETASLFGETLVFHSLISREKDPKVVLSMLVREIESSFAAVFRQVAMKRFEEAAHTARRTTGELTTGALSEMWLETQRAMFGTSVTLTPDCGIWWSYITHFIHVPGYVYAYAFGDLLVRALYKRSLSGGKDSPRATWQCSRPADRTGRRRSSGPLAWTLPIPTSGRRDLPSSRGWSRRRRT